jgi:hypothetical protein
MNAQWTDGRNGYTIEVIKNVLLLQYNLRDYLCLQYNKCLLEQPNLLREIKSSNKYAGATSS